MSPLTLELISAPSPVRGIGLNSDRTPFLHHLGIISRNLPDSITHYERLGFKFAPLTVPRLPLHSGRDPEPVGMANCCAIFRNNYLEMLGVIDSALWASISVEQRGPFDLDAPLRRYEGLHVLHLGADDLDAVRARLLRQNIQPSEIRPYQRLIDTCDGPKMMRARSLSFPHGSNPEALVQIAQHQTPELVLQPRYMDHPNGATCITEVLVCVENPESVADKYATYSGCPAQRRGELHVVDLGRSRITILSPDYLPKILPGCAIPTLPFLAGFVVSSDLAQAAGALTQRGVDFHVHDGRILVDARFGCGTAVIFEGAHGNQ